MVEELDCNNTLIAIPHHRADYRLSPVIMKGCTLNEASMSGRSFACQFHTAGKWSVFCVAPLSTWLFLICSAFTRAYQTKMEYSWHMSAGSAQFSLSTLSNKVCVALCLLNCFQSYNPISHTKSIFSWKKLQFLVPPIHISQLRSDM